MIMPSWVNCGGDLVNLCVVMIVLVKGRLQKRRRKFITFSCCKTRYRSIFESIILNYMGLAMIVLDKGH